MIEDEQEQIAEMRRRNRALEPQRFREDLSEAESNNARGFMAPVAFSRSLLSIVEALARQQPLENDICETELWYCPLCAGGGRAIADAFVHRPECPWRQARELLGVSE